MIPFDGALYDRYRLFSYIIFTIKLYHWKTMEVAKKLWHYDGRKGKEKQKRQRERIIKRYPSALFALGGRVFISMIIKGVASYEIIRFLWILRRKEERETQYIYPREYFANKNLILCNCQPLKWSLYSMHSACIYVYVFASCRVTFCYKVKVETVTNRLQRLSPSDISTKHFDTDGSKTNLTKRPIYLI